MDIPPVSKRFKLYNSARQRSFKALQFGLIRRHRLFYLKSRAWLTQPGFGKAKTEGRAQIFVRAPEGLWMERSLNANSPVSTADGN